VGIYLSGSDVKNAADVIVKTPLTLLGRNAALIFNFGVGLFFVVALLCAGTEEGLNIGIFLPMFLESLLYALLMGPLIDFIQSEVVPVALAINGGRVIDLILAIGAGLYEEIVYRLILLSVIYAIFHRVLKFKQWFAATLSIVLASLVFAALHYIGSLSDTFSGETFLFRFLAGIFLSSIFILRGLGIAVYTHALYDILLVIA